jgi:hypothetical protein
MLKPDTIKIQQDLAMYCRSGKEQDIAGVTEGRLPHYRRLVLDVVYGTIAQAYPITRKVLSEKEWDYIFNNFFIEHDAQTPILWRLPYEFYLYVKALDYAGELGKPWLNELLWFEWLEIEVHMMPDEDHGEYSESGDIEHDTLVLNKDSRLIKLQYPFHIRAVELAENEPGNYYVFIYREHDTGTVRFTNLSVLHAWLFDTMLHNPGITLKEIFPEMLTTFKLENIDTAKKKTLNFLREMIESGAILGFRNSELLTK